MKTKIKTLLTLITLGLIVFQCDLFDPKDKVTSDDLVSMLALQQINANSMSEAQRLGLNVAYSHRFSIKNGPHLFCREYSTAYLEKQAEWEKDMEQTYTTIGNAIGIQIVVERLNGPCAVTNKVAACHYDGVDGINDLIPYAYTTEGEHKYLIPANAYYGTTDLKSAKEACERFKGTYVCYDPSKCWQ
ncbi:LIC_11695 family lipoprotein [Leptospira kanakyensis]|uniref:Lipoprotein n=1 Tax=Leptospira kanakyensis TaxID=2484968 RepID=A0A6N4Q7P2_9LEPT|nr:LIC_11695 family lipoprotein [Leptospira kanakyensis]MCW7468447.1 LIC_11695 family lipoprotein [Leptospira kanakyensis]MCW7482825.1 LIC_11695 family lipoprotein [Leptospira kanakyensis]TGK55521.1 lipoprotein [Leptospira kanakyensis]TGK61056.1 lipoprotein [Leptospira kanakyensis]TGK76472.1 lipoprotein [Leptospira kanakyensis]